MDSGPRATRRPHRDGEGAPGGRDRQQRELRPLELHVVPLMRGTKMGAPTPGDSRQSSSRRSGKSRRPSLAHLADRARSGVVSASRRVPPPTVTLFGSPFLTWRGLPLIPSDKLAVGDDGKTNVLLLRTGEKKRGVVGLFQPGLAQAKRVRGRLAPRPAWHQPARRLHSTWCRSIAREGGCWRRDDDRRLRINSVEVGKPP